MRFHSNSSGSSSAAADYKSEDNCQAIREHLDSQFWQKRRACEWTAKKNVKKNATSGIRYTVISWKKSDVIASL